MSKSNRCYSIFMTHQLFQHFSCFNIPNDNWAIISSWIHSLSHYLNRIYPTFVTLIQFCFPCGYVERSDYWITTGNKYMRIRNLHALDRLFWSDETFYYFVLFKVDASYHFIPRCSKKHVILRRYYATRDGISKLKNSHACACITVPLSNCAIVWHRNNITRMCRNYWINSIGVTN